MMRAGNAHGFRRLVIGNNSSGRSCIVDDRRIVEGRAGNHDIWSSPAQDAVSDPDKLILNQNFYPLRGEIYFRYFRIPPESSGLTHVELDAIAAEMFEGFGILDARVDTSRHPMMHVTPTIDVVVLLSGKVSLFLDIGDAIDLNPFDTIIQRGTNHAWVNKGPEDAFLMAVMQGAR